MAQRVTADLSQSRKLHLPKSVRARLYRDRHVYLIMLPAILYLLVFRYLPMWGILLAFVNYNPIRGPIWSIMNRWVGLEIYREVFGSANVPRLLRNTFVISGMRLLFAFPIPIILTLLMNEVRSALVKRSIQSAIYLPYFLSWVVIAAITSSVLSPNSGMINRVIAGLGGTPIHFLMRPQYFRSIIVVQGIWQSAGWGTVIYLAALSGVNPELYECADLDGAGRFAKMRFISLPALRSTIIILFILALGRLIDENFQQIFLMMNPITREVADVFETFTFRMGIINGRISYAIAVGAFKSVVSATMVIIANSLIRRAGEQGMY